MADAQRTGLVSSGAKNTRLDPELYRPELAYGGPVAIDATDEDKACYVLARYSVQNDHYAGLYQQWIKPIYFLVGKQWIKWEEDSLSYALDTDVPKWKQQPVTNWTYAVYRTLLAKLTKQRPTLDVVPPSGDSEDREAAKLGEAILQHLWRLLKSPAKMARAIGWLLATGNVALQPDWDPEGGELRARTVLIEVPHPELPGQTMDVECPCDENGEPYTLPDGTPDFEREPEMDPIGEQIWTVVDPLSYRWDPDATSEDDAVEFFEASMWPVELIASTFDVDVGSIKIGGNESGEDRDALDEMLQSVTAGAPDPFDSKMSKRASSRHGEASNRALVIKYYRKPSVKEGFPKGRHFIIAGGTKVWPKTGEAEYPDGESTLPHDFWPPVVPIIDCPVPGQLGGLGVLSQVVPLNEKYNYNDGKIGEYHTVQAMGGVTWVHPDDKGIRITSEPGQVKPSKGMAHGHPPIREKLEALPAEVYREREIIQSNLQAIAGTSQLDMGQRPEGVTAGRAFLVIQEASDAAIGPTLQALENAIEELGRRQLVLAQRYYSEERTIAIRGERGRWEFRSFSNADLADGLDVRVQAGSSFPWSKSAQFDTKISLLEAMPWLAVDPQSGAPDPQRASKLLDFSSMGLTTFTTDEDPDLNEIAREHSMFEEYDPADPTKSNQLPQLAFWQDQLKHQQGHYEFLKKDMSRFERWSPAAQIAFIEHCRLTTEAVAEMVKATMPALGGGDNPDEDPEAPGAAGAAPKPGGGPPKSGAGAKKSDQQLTKGDRAAAGQTA